MERVQYQLERSIPQLRLLEEHRVFSKEELRSLVSQRQALESRLLRRGLELTDYMRYLELEQNLDRLINTKAKRLGLPRTFTHANSAIHTGHMISIYERMVQKFKHDTHSWLAYIEYARTKKMRVVTGRVMARALALHTTDVELWILAASYELNDNSSTTAARSLLQRALRLVELPTADRPGQASSGPVRLRLSDREKDLLLIWVEYIRMELVFIERLRRRWLILGLQWDSEEHADEPALDENSEAVQAGVDLEADAETSSNKQTDTEKALLNQIPDAEPDSQLAAPNTLAPRQLTAIPPSQVAILRGNIPVFLISSALQTLAPSLHFAFLTSLTKMFRDFPFAEPLDSGAKRSGEALRTRLLQSVYAALRDQQRWTWDNFTPAALFASIQPFFDSQHIPLDSEAKASQIANQEELTSHKLLLKASRLSDRLDCNDMLRLTSWLSAEDAQQVAPAHFRDMTILRELELQLRLDYSKEPSPLVTRLAASGALPKTVRDTVEYLQSLCRQAPKQGHNSKSTPKSELYTATVLLLEQLATPARSSIDEPNLLAYLEAVKSQLLKEAQSAGPGVESAHLRARSLRKTYDAALKNKAQNNKHAKLVQDLAKATTDFPASEELWLLYIQAKTELGGPLDPNAIIADWKKALTASLEKVDVQFTSPYKNLWTEYFDHLDSSLPSKKTKSSGPVKSSLANVEAHFQWAVQKTGSHLSRAASGHDVEGVQKYRQTLHDLSVERYFDFAAEHGKDKEVCHWLLRSCFASPTAWQRVTSSLMVPKDNRCARSKYDLAETVWAKILSNETALREHVYLRSSYLQHLALHDMPKALTVLQKFETTLSESDYAVVQNQWQKILNLVEQVGSREVV